MRKSEISARDFELFKKKRYSYIDKLSERGVLLESRSIGSRGRTGKLNYYKLNPVFDEAFHSDLEKTMRDNQSGKLTFSELPAPLIRDGIGNIAIAFGDSRRHVSGRFAPIDDAVCIPQLIVKLSSKAINLQIETIIDIWLHIHKELSEAIKDKDILTVGGPVVNFVTRKVNQYSIFRAYYEKTPMRSIDWYTYALGATDPFHENGWHSVGLADAARPGLGAIALAPSPYNRERYCVAAVGATCLGTRVALMLLSDQLDGWKELRHRPFGGVFEVIFRTESDAECLKLGYSKLPEYEEIIDLNWLTPRYTIDEIKSQIRRNKNYLKLSETKQILEFIEKMER